MARPLHLHKFMEFLDKGKAFGMRRLKGSEELTDIAVKLTCSEATRFSFDIRQDEELTNRMYQIGFDLHKQAVPTKLPVSPIWIEWDVDMGDSITHVGIVTQQLNLRDWDQGEEVLEIYKNKLTQEQMEEIEVYCSYFFTQDVPNQRDMVICLGPQIWDNHSFYLPCPIGHDLEDDMPEDVQQDLEYFVTGVYILMTGIFSCLNDNLLVTDEEYAPSPKLNRKRERHGKLPLLEYKTLKVNPTVIAGKSAPQGGTHASPRYHLRRGHWRHLTDQKVWIKPTMVGNPEDGRIIKDYQIEVTHGRTT